MEAGRDSTARSTRLGINPDNAEDLPSLRDERLELRQRRGLDLLCLVAARVNSGRGDHTASLAHLRGRFHELEALGAFRGEVGVDRFDGFTYCGGLVTFGETERSAQHEIKGIVRVSDMVWL